MIRGKRDVPGIITLIFSILFFGLGVYFPLLSTKTRALGINWSYEAFNLLDTVGLFFENKEYFLASIILLFTIIIPIVKYIELIFRITGRQEMKQTMQQLDKWNMLDVFLVALLLLNYKMNSNIILMELRSGTTFIALAVIFRILTIILITNNKTNKG